LLRSLPGDRAFLPPSPPRSLLLKNLTPASGCQDATTSPSAMRAFVSRAPTSIASRLTFRDDRDTPLLPRRDGDPSIAVSTNSRNEIFFSMGLDFGGQISCVPKKLSSHVGRVNRRRKAPLVAAPCPLPLDPRLIPPPRARASGGEGRPKRSEARVGGAHQRNCMPGPPPPDTSFAFAHDVPPSPHSLRSGGGMSDDLHGKTFSGSHTTCSSNPAASRP